jgi:hypothetical protein
VSQPITLLHMRYLPIWKEKTTKKMRSDQVEFLVRHLQHTDLQLHHYTYLLWNVHFISLFISQGLKIWPLLWSSGQSSWLQIQKSVFYSRRYQIFREVVGLQRGPNSLVSTIEELLRRKSSGSGLENRKYCSRGSAAPRYTSLFAIWHQLSRQAAVARSVYFAGGLRPRSFFKIFSKYFFRCTAEAYIIDLATQILQIQACRYEANHTVWIRNEIPRTALNKRHIETQWSIISDIFHIFYSSFYVGMVIWIDSTPIQN